MKPIIKIATYFLIAGIVFSSCKKDKAPQQQTNKPPFANAGVDRVIALPTDSVSLDGSSSGDPDGSISHWLWTKISGPAFFTFGNKATTKTIVKNLIVGTYQFELKVFDNGGLSAKDTVQVIVDARCGDNRPAMNLNFILFGELSIPRAFVAAATAGNKILFAGGSSGERDPLTLFSRVDIYDISTETWGTAELSEARTGVGAITVGNKILFAGGAKNFNENDDWYNLSKRVDIYDVSTNSWTIAELPEPISFSGGQGATAVAGNKAFFFGGDWRYRRDRVYIYDVVANSWSSAQLSTDRNEFTAVSIGNKILVTGHSWEINGTASRKVDIYDANTNVWSINSLSETRYFLHAGTLNGKAYFAGACQPCNSEVDIYDNATQSWSTACLSRTVGVAGVASAGNKILFFGDRRVDIYDASSDTWFIADILQPLSFSDRLPIISAAGNIYVVFGGTKVWRVQF